MARYLEVAAEIAREVRSGALRPGDQLAAVRVCARDSATTSTTIVRAYHHLAEGGVITVSGPHLATAGRNMWIAVAAR